MKKPILFLGAAVDIIILDQLSKWWISEHFIRQDNAPVGLIPWMMDAPERLPYHDIFILPFFNLVMVWNQGISFGLFNQDTDYGPLVLSILALVVSLFFMIWLFRSHNTLQMSGLALVIGGALGNVIDRFRFGAVMDFLDFHGFGYHWPAFNIADSAIMIGVFILILHSVFFDKPLAEKLENE